MQLQAYKIPEFGGMRFNGRLVLPETHKCGPFLGEDCLICLLERQLLHGEVVSVKLVVHDVDEE